MNLLLMKVFESERGLGGQGDSFDNVTTGLLQSSDGLSSGAARVFHQSGNFIFWDVTGIFVIAFSFVFFDLDFFLSLSLDFLVGSFGFTEVLSLVSTQVTGEVQEFAFTENDITAFGGFQDIWIINVQTEILVGLQGTSVNT